MPRTKDIVDTAVAAGQFKTLAAALSAAGLVDTLKGAGPFTVFAPTDEAFAKLPPGTVEDLLKPENKAKLTAILTYHVVPGKVMAADVVKLKDAKTVNGRVDQGVNDGWRSVMVDEAQCGEDRHRGVERRHPRHRHRDDAEELTALFRGRRLCVVTPLPFDGEHHESTERNYPRSTDRRRPELGPRWPV